jgi:hypothetical protein
MRHSNCFGALRQLDAAAGDLVGMKALYRTKRRETMLPR